MTARRTAFALMLFAVVVAAFPAEATGQRFQAWAYRFRYASSEFRTGGWLVFASASILESVRDDEPLEAGPAQSARSEICAYVKNPSGKFDTGCALFPAVVDAVSGVAHASGTITPSNCSSVTCPKGTITMNVSWAATSPLLPQGPGVPGCGLDLFYACMNAGLQLRRDAVASGTVSSSVAGTFTGTSTSGYIWDVLATYVTVYPLG